MTSKKVTVGAGSIVAVIIAMIIIWFLSSSD